MSGNPDEMPGRGVTLWWTEIPRKGEGGEVTSYSLHAKETGIKLGLDGLSGLSKDFAYYFSGLQSSCILEQFESVQEIFWVF